tara:strand:+ start:10 stop:516 length:507 start_codon:yes stop_codon:yes gene_type:complete
MVPGELQMKLGLLVDNLGASQLSYYIGKNVNGYLEENPESDIVCYYDSFERNCVNNNFATANIIEAWSQSGAMIATSENTASKLATFIGTRNKFFYIWDIVYYLKRFAGRKYVDTFTTGSIYSNKNLKLICRSESHAKIIENNFNRKVEYIVDNLNMHKMMEIVNNES